MKIILSIVQMQEDTNFSMFNSIDYLIKQNYVFKEASFIKIVSGFHLMIENIVGTGAL